MDFAGRSVSGGGDLLDGDRLRLDRLKVRPERGKVKIKGTLLPAIGTAIRPEDELVVLLDGAPVVVVPPGGLVETGRSGLAYRYEDETVRVKLKLSAAGHARLKVRCRGLESSISGNTIRVETGDFLAESE